MDAQADPAEWTNAFPDADFPANGTNEDFYRAVEEFYADRYIKIKIYCREVLSTFANVYTMLINEV